MLGPWKCCSQKKSECTRGKHLSKFPDPSLTFSWPLEEQHHRVGKTLFVEQLRPSKCPTFYTNKILGEQNLRQKVSKFCQSLNSDKMIYLIKYTLTAQFSK